MKSSFRKIASSILIASVACAFVACGDSDSSTSAKDDEKELSSSSVVDVSSSSPGEKSSSSKILNSSATDFVSSSSQAKSSSCNEKSSSSDAKFSSSEVMSSSSDANFSSSEVMSSSSDVTSSSSEVSFSSSNAKDDSSSAFTGLSSSSENVILDKNSYINLDVKYGSMVDERDNKVYRTIVIGGQTWFAENLNYSDSVNTPSLKENSCCYGNNEAGCDAFGRLYTWAAAIDSVALANDGTNPQDCGYRRVCDRLKKDALAQSPVQGVCPKNWHLPSFEEWNTLFENVGGVQNAGKLLKSSSGWKDDGNGIDQYGFSAIPSGRRNQGRFGFGIEADFWSASQSEGDEKYGQYAFYMFLTSYDDWASLSGSDLSKFNTLSVRCLKD